MVETNIFWHLHDIAIINAYLIYKYNNHNSLHNLLTPKQFCLELAKELANPYILSRKTFGRSPSLELDRLKSKHFLYRSDVRTCTVCSYRKRKASPRGKKYKDKKIKTRCLKCQVNLCEGKCSELYHTKVDYRSSMY